MLKAFDAAIEEQEGQGNVAKLREMRSELMELLEDTRRLG